MICVCVCVCVHVCVWGGGEEGGGREGEKEGDLTVVLPTYGGSLHAFSSVSLSLLPLSVLSLLPLPPPTSSSPFLLFSLSPSLSPPFSLLPPTSRSGILGELSVMVQGSPTVQDKLGPALLHTYAAVSVVEGLDVDKENFDKYATR